jgi:DEAD/DEAH box helicase domain-containing protein
VDDFVEWVGQRDYYHDQIQFQREIPGRTRVTRSCEMDPLITDRLADRGIGELYAHQTDAIDAVRNGRNVVLATPTASRKSLAYTIPALERAHDHDGRTLYIGPQVALINDQEATLSDFAAPFEDVAVTQYTGALSSHERQQAREDDPAIVLTTPDMLHCGLLIGSVVSHFRIDRTRACGRPGKQFQPTLSVTRATSGERSSNPSNSWSSTRIPAKPARHTGCSGNHRNTDEGDAPAGAGKRRSHHGETMRLFVDLVQHGYQTVAFTRARQTAERYATISSDTLTERGESDFAETVTAYHAGLRDDRRGTIETALHAGECAGVWSTSALELGVDIGGLDAVLLDGYPGTQMSTFQRAGRAGRGTEPSLVALVILCDRRDVGRVSTTDHPQAETSALFIYDNYRGGVGLARNGYDNIEDLFKHTWELLADCGCSDGCPACIQSPHCGRANEPLDKRLAATLTMALADPSRQADDGTPKSD